MVVLRRCKAPELVYCSGSSRKRTMPAAASISANISPASTILHDKFCIESDLRKLITALVDYVANKQLSICLGNAYTPASYQQSRVCFQQSIPINLDIFLWGEECQNTFLGVFTVVCNAILRSKVHSLCLVPLHDVDAPSKHQPRLGRQHGATGSQKYLCF